MLNESFKIKKPDTQEIVDLMQLEKDEVNILLNSISQRGLFIIRDLTIKLPKSERSLIILALVDEILHKKYGINSFLTLRPDHKIVDINFICPDPEECID